MRFQIDLSRTEQFPELPLEDDEERDDFHCVICDICEALADGSSAGFTVSGFGQERWPVDVRTDLAVFLEQLPSALAAVESGAPFSLDFYEQGIERFIRFERKGDEYSERCESYTEWKPDPAIETIGRLELRNMLGHALDDFMRFLSSRAPRAAARPWVRDWAGRG